jgi:hypothetical protein
MMKSIPYFVANSVRIIAESLKKPGINSIVQLDTGEFEISTPGRPDVLGMAVKRPKTRNERLSSDFKLAIIIVAAITLISLVVEIGLAIWAKEPSTGFQQSLFQAADFGWKTGFGALVGLVAGKQT